MIMDRKALEEIGERIAEQAAHLDAATHRLLTDIRVFDRESGWFKQGARTCAQWLSWQLGWGLGVAREHVRVAAKLAELPVTDEALRTGELSYCKVRAIMRWRRLRPKQSSWSRRASPPARSSN